MIEGNNIPNHAPEENPNPTCHACNYSLRGFVHEDATRCPECGAYMADAPPQVEPWRPKKLLRRVTITLTSGFGFLFLAFSFVLMVGDSDSRAFQIFASFLFGPAVTIPKFLAELLGSRLVVVLAIGIITAFQLLIYGTLGSWAREKHRLHWLLSAIVLLHLACSFMTAFIIDT